MLGAVQATLLVPVGPLTYVYDTFAGAGNLTGHTPDVNLFASAWQSLGDLTWVIVSGYIRSSSVGTLTFNHIDTGGTETYKNTFIIKHSNTYTVSGVVARSLSNATNWLFALTGSGGWKVAIYENKTTLRSSQVVTATTGVYYPMEINWSGDTATITFNGSVTTASYSCTSKGNYWGPFMSNGGADVYIDNYRLEKAV